MTIIEAPAAATTDDWRVVLRRYLVFAAAANLVWETAHLPLYTIWASGSARELAFAVAHCGGGDVLLAMSSLVAALLLVGAGWPASAVAHNRVAALTVTLAVAATMLIEWINVVVRQGWAYSDLMPVLPVIGTGLSPVAQWVVIPLIGLWWARLAVTAAGRGRQMDRMAIGARNRHRSGKQSMRLLLAASLALAAWSAAATPTAAHSLEELQSALLAREQFFQAVDRPAPAFTLQDADGRTVRLGDLRGKVLVLHFIYASCPDVCPLHADRIAEIQGMVNETPMRNLVQFVTITTDPAHDTPDVLREYGPAHGLDPASWMFLTSGPQQPEDTTRRLAQDFGHRFDVTSDGNQLHGVVTHVIDQDGRWTGNFHGLEFAPISLVVYVNALTNNPRRPHDHGDQGLWSRMRALFR